MPQILLQFAKITKINYNRQSPLQILHKCTSFQCYIKLNSQPLAPSHFYCITLCWHGIRCHPVCVCECVCVCVACWILSGATQSELVPEETFTHSHPTWSSVIPYRPPPSIMIHGILSVQFTCLTVFFHNLSLFHIFLHPIIVFFSQHTPIPSQLVLL